MEKSNSNIQNKDYYSKKSDKVIDFIIGFLGTFACIFIFYYLIALIMPVGAKFLPIIIFFILMYLISKIKRSYIMKGIKYALLIIVLIPILFFGACLIALGGYGY